MKTIEDIAHSPVTSTNDLTFVGAGLSATYTLIRLCEQLSANPPSKPLNVTMLEKSGDFFGGIPYGSRSGPNSLIITPLKEFLPEPELELFQQWLRANAEEVLEEFTRREGPRSTEWLGRVGPSIKSGDCAEYHVPRFVWGRYLTDTVATVVNRAVEQDALRLSLLSAEALAVSREGTETEFQIETTSGPIGSNKVVLALGMPPTRKIFGDATVNGLLVEEPYTPNLDSTMDVIAKAVQGHAEPRIVVVGANAGSLEMLYMLANHPEIEACNPAIDVLSPQGQLPERYNEKPDPAFVPSHLPDLLGHGSVTANDILKAVELDLADARSDGLGISDSLPPISSAVGTLLPQLTPKEMEAFVAHPGVEIGRLQRRAGDEYCDAAEDLATAGRLRVISGRFTTVSTGEHGTSVHFTDSDGAGQSIDACSVVVNCAGSGGLQVPNQSELLQSMLTSGVCEPTASGHGLQVNDNLEASPGIYVNGPLLAGNVVNGSGIWHVEHCGRIINFSTQLAATLHSALTV